MILVALAFVITFTSLFLWQTVTALSTGVFKSLGWSVRRSDTPIFFWSGVASSVVCIVGGLFFLLMLLGGLGGLAI